MTKRFNIVKPTKYEKDGQEKTRWDTVGTLLVFEKGGRIEIPAIGLEAQVFPVSKDAEKGEELKPEDIPF